MAIYEHFRRTSFWHWKWRSHVSSQNKVELIIFKQVRWGILYYVFLNSESNDSIYKSIRTIVTKSRQFLWIKITKLYFMRKLNIISFILCSKDVFFLLIKYWIILHLLNVLKLAIINTIRVTCVIFTFIEVLDAK